jgi:lysozyme family protein
MKHEGAGILSDNKIDPGGKTYSGISRVYWPDWEGWAYVDEFKNPPFEMVEKFYRVNFWNRIQGDTLAEISLEVACEVFDTAVNCGVTAAVRFLQIAYNTSRGGYGEDLLVDGKLGPKTIIAIGRYMSSRPGGRELNEEIMLNCLNGEQYIFYKGNPKHKVFRGWFTRV